MTRIEAIIQPGVLEKVESAMLAIGIQRLVITEVAERNLSNGPTACYRGARYRVSMPRLKVEILVPSDRSEEALSALRQAARCTSADDGTVIAYELAEAVLIHSGVHLQYSDV